MKEQQGKCATCLASGKKLKIDHDHKTLAVRQLLCENCNTGFGRIDENIYFMQNAKEYLLRNGHK